MIIRIPGLLNADELQTVCKILATGQFVDGKLSAGKEARRVKNNEELSPKSVVLEQLNNLVMGTLVRNPTYQSAGLPVRVAAPYYVRYSVGMSYGEHVDDPVMGLEDRYRSDLAITIFLNSPDSYDGGELLIRTSMGTQEVKFAAGDGVLYPASSLHQVREVKKGERLVAVTWAQSLVRDPARRELLFELSQARDHLLETAPGANATALISKSYVNLLRMWSEV
ncbi:MAG: Fe2+-dependent dioxygenase [Gammaproteobacteria bacterium]